MSEKNSKFYFSEYGLSFNTVGLNFLYCTLLLSKFTLISAMNENVISVKQHTLSEIDLVGI